MHIVLSQFRNPLPDGTAEAGGQIVGRAALHAVPPYVIIVIWVIFSFQRFLEPEMLVGGMIEHKIHDDADVVLFRFRNQAVHVVEAAEDRVDILIIGDIVTVIFLRGTVNRGEPDGVDAQVLQIVQMFDDTRNITDTVSVGILKSLRVDLIDDCFFPPFVVHVCISFLL